MKKTYGLLILIIFSSLKSYSGGSFSIASQYLDTYGRLKLYNCNATTTFVGVFSFTRDENSSDEYYFNIYFGNHFNTNANSYAKLSSPCITSKGDIVTISRWKDNVASFSCVFTVNYQNYASFSFQNVDALKIFYVNDFDTSPSLSSYDVVTVSGRQGGGTCNRCSPSLTLSNSLSSTSYSASGNITASNLTVAGGAHIVFNASKTILQTGFKAASSGNTTFKATVNPCQAGTRMAFDDDGLNMESGEFASATVYPNPNNGSFSIGLPSDKNIYSMELYDVLGTKVFTDQISGVYNKEYNLANVSSGLYVVHINGGGTFAKEKIQIFK